MGALPSMDCCENRETLSSTNVRIIQMAPADHRGHAGSHVHRGLEKADRDQSPNRTRLPGHRRHDRDSRKHDLHYSRETRSVSPARVSGKAGSSHRVGPGHYHSGHVVDFSCSLPCIRISHCKLSAFSVLHLPFVHIVVVSRFTYVAHDGRLRIRNLQREHTTLAQSQALSLYATGLRLAQSPVTSQSCTHSWPQSPLPGLRKRLSSTSLVKIRCLLSEASLSVNARAIAVVEEVRTNTEEQPAPDGPDGRSYAMR